MAHFPDPGEDGARKPMAMQVRIVQPYDFPAIRVLFREYAESIGVDLSFQHFEEEVAELPGEYAAPRGGLFLAVEGEQPVGCIGLRPFSTDTGELKRLYVVPAWRGRGIGRALIGEAIRAAEEMGYAALVLDTLRGMAEAIAIYEAFGFRRTGAYYANPLPEVVYFRRELR